MIVCFVGIRGIIDHHCLHFFHNVTNLHYFQGAVGRDRDHMVVGFSTTCAISDYHH
jgi:hypothetical protein